MAENRRPPMPSLITTLGGTIAAVYSRCQSQRNYEFAMDTQKSLYFVAHRTVRSVIAPSAPNARPQGERGNRSRPDIPEPTPRLNPHSLPQRCRTTDRDFVPWHFSNAGHRKHVEGSRFAGIRKSAQLLP